MIWEFRFNNKGSDGRKCRGFIEAFSKEDLFWKLDRFSNPYEANVRIREGVCLAFWEGAIEDESDDMTDKGRWIEIKEGFI
jgi:hypothetical protein